MASSSRSVRAESRREELLAAATRVFARKGYHASRVSDIADEAGVSHGLVYHYFPSKDAVLESLFRENWGGVAAAIDAIASTDDSTGEQLRKIAAVMLHAWRRDEDAVRVLVREISRSSALQARIGEFQQTFDTIEAVIERGQHTGELDATLDPSVATIAVWGMLDEVLTAWTLGRLAADVDRAEATVSAMLRRALAG